MRRAVHPCVREAHERPSPSSQLPVVDQAGLHAAESPAVPGRPPFALISASDPRHHAAVTPSLAAIRRLAWRPRLAVPVGAPAVHSCPLGGSIDPRRSTPRTPSSSSLSWLFFPSPRRRIAPCDMSRERWEVNQILPNSRYRSLLRIITTISARNRCQLHQSSPGGIEEPPVVVVGPCVMKILGWVPPLPQSPIVRRVP